MDIDIDTRLGQALRRIATGDCFGAACHMHRSGHAEAAMAGYRAVLAADPTHAAARLNLAQLRQHAGDWAGAIAELETLLAQDPRNEKAWRSLSWARLHARLQQSRTASPARGRHAVLLACLPKTGSTFLSEALAALPGMRRAHLVMGYEHHEQELVLDHLLTYSGTDYVAQHHIRHSEATAELCRLFDLKVVVLVRNLFDIMVSLRDHLMRLGLDFSMARVDPAFRAWDEATQYRFIADMFLPWFVTFYVGWVRAGDRLLIGYEELLCDAPCLVARAAAHAGMAVSPQQALAAVAAARARPTLFNKGVIGRGTAVPAAVRARVLDQLAWYSDVDFTPLIGRGAETPRRELAG